MLTESGREKSAIAMDCTEPGILLCSSPTGVRPGVALTVMRLRLSTPRPGLWARTRVWQRLALDCRKGGEGEVGRIAASHARMAQYAQTWPVVGGKEGMHKEDKASETQCSALVCREAEGGKRGGAHGGG